MKTYKLAGLERKLQEIENLLPYDESDLSMMEGRTLVRKIKRTLVEEDVS